MAITVEPIYVGDTAVHMGNGWIVCAPGDVTRAQRRTMISASNGGDDYYCAHRWNERSRYVAFTVSRADESTDVYTVSPLGDLNYVISVDRAGRKEVR